MTFHENFYVIESHSYIKNIPTNFCLEFLTELKNDDGSFKPHVEKIIENVFYYGKQCIKATIPICFVEITYKNIDGDTYFISHDEHLYGDNMPNMEALKAYQEATSYSFASQVSQEVIDLIEAFHLGYGCECLSNGDY